MKFYKPFFLFIAMVSNTAFGQIRGQVFDALSKEPIIGASVKIENSILGTRTDSNGFFEILNENKNVKLLVSCVGYVAQSIDFDKNTVVKIAIWPATQDLQTLVVTANREATLRTEAPVAIAKINTQTILDTKATLLVELINKVPGVVMTNLNNEQHSMSIRQPLNLSAYFLYLEDGLPIRPTGVFSANALIEMNLMGISNIEVIKGPASSLYGPEAVGGAINFISQKPTAVPVAKVGIQADQYGYRRVQFGVGGMLNKKMGAFVSGFVADQKNSWIAYSDYEKISLNARIDYAFNPKTRLTAALSQNNYRSDMTGSIDSIAFYSRQYEASNDFAYRKIRALRVSLRIDHHWNDHAETFMTLFFRDNAMGQNPSYSFRWTAPSTKATGEINENAFKSFGFLMQHSQGFKLLNSKLLLGLSYDDSPARYFAYKTEMTATLRADKKSVSKYTLDRELPDVFLSNYKASIYNTGIYAQLELIPVAKMKVVFGGRLDRMSFDFLNYIDNSTGTKVYQQFTPKIGLTYDLNNGKGLYANASKGFSPPSLNAIFRLRPNPVPQGDLFYFNLLPAVFNNIEVGGWATALQKKIYLDWAIYQMKGQNELLNIRQQDNSFDYQSAGQTLHRGIEYSVTYKPNKQWFMRFGGTNSLHRYIKFDLSLRASDLIKNVDGKNMPVAPTWIYNTEINYKPKWAKGFRIAAEWQRLNGYFQNQINSAVYEDRGFLGAKGVSILNIRTGYQLKNVEFFMNILNASNELYANNITRGNLPSDRPNFTASAPRTFTLGMQYNFAGQ